MASYEKLFAGKLSVLFKRLEVSLQFLLILQDYKVITGQHAEKINAKISNYEKAAELLDILTRRPDDTVRFFFLALGRTGQEHIIQILQPADGMANDEDSFIRYRSPQENIGSSGRRNQFEDLPSPIQPTEKRLTRSFAIILPLSIVILVFFCYIQFYPGETSTTEDSAKVPNGVDTKATPYTGSFRAMFHGRRSGLVMHIDVSHGLWISLKDKDLLTEWQLEDCQAQKNEYDQISKMLDLLELREDSLVPKFCEALAETGNYKVLDEFLHNVCLPVTRY